MTVHTSDEETQSGHVFDVRDASTWRRIRVAGLVMGLVCLGWVGGAVFSMGRGGTHTNIAVQRVEEKDNVVPIVPSRPACSKKTDNCASTGCCQTSGHTCFETMQGAAFCNETCQPGYHGYTCKPHGWSLPAVYNPGTSMYCFSVYTEDTGSSAPEEQFQLQLLQQQKKATLGIFQCLDWDVFGDVVAPLGNGMSTIRVNDDLGEFHQEKRKDTGTWVNWGLYFQVWKKVREVAKWQRRDYTIKVDPSTVFLPSRLASWLQGKPVTQRGVYYENCPGVDSGFFGNIEVVSHDGVAIYTTLLENCHDAFAQCAKTGCDWEYGPWGEDVFAQRCMDRGFVSKVEAFDLTTDGNCPKNRPPGQEHNKKWQPNCATTHTAAMHPFKIPAQWWDCYQKTVNI